MVADTADGADGVVGSVFAHWPLFLDGPRSQPPLAAEDHLNPKRAKGRGLGPTQPASECVPWGLFLARHPPPPPPPPPGADFGVKQGQQGENNRGNLFIFRMTSVVAELQHQPITLRSCRYGVESDGWLVLGADLGGAEPWLH